MIPESWQTRFADIASGHKIEFLKLSKVKTTMLVIDVDNVDGELATRQEGKIL